MSLTSFSSNSCFASFHTDSTARTAVPWSARAFQSKRAASSVDSDASLIICCGKSLPSPQEATVWCCEKPFLMGEYGSTLGFSKATTS
ncbi:MAG: hypothetical protein E6Q66_04670 [Pedobacter sp.]|nr:MAG: hypothetical protein E6Q66_04670 [Pedobacter sp.]